jgi:catechol 2,3-dioxygenase-like lactoylglutathione lyase family enzyme
VAITGVHALIYTSEPDAVRAIFRDVFGFEHVDLGDNWLIFKLPPAELGIHPAEHELRRDISLMCDDLGATMAELREKGIEFEGEPLDEGWGITITMLLPGGASLLLYEPRHETAAY